MNTKTIEQFNTMTTEELACVEGGNQVFAGGGGVLKPDYPWWRIDPLIDFRLL
ncbi:bacteriocin class II family protein [Streptococcus equinus]|uniref:bacteriocin class II family protein n=1 Tax=Streptococcus equinus TaxID=1335 RepID=UPI0008ECB467|nr:bacteriocin class II family protein [Streptococcus equinus]SFC23296.1 bacteriocin-type signal sequence-containing protein [Streptococcus equinus]